MNIGNMVHANHGKREVRHNPKRISFVTDNRPNYSKKTMEDYIKTRKWIYNAEETPAIEYGFEDAQIEEAIKEVLLIVKE